AYQSNETGRFEIYVQPFPAGLRGRLKVSTAGGTNPRWQPDGKELYFIAPDGKLMAVSVRIQAGAFEAGSPVALFQTRVASVAGANLFHSTQSPATADSSSTRASTIRVSLASSSY